MLAGLLLAACGGGHDASHAGTRVIDPPAIVCPADVTVRGVPGPSQAVTFTAPAVTGGAAPVTTTLHPGIGRRVPARHHLRQLCRDRRAIPPRDVLFSVTLTGIRLGVTKFEAIGDSLTEGQNGLPEVQSPSFVDPPNSYPTKLQACSTRLTRDRASS